MPGLQFNPVYAKRHGITNPTIKRLQARLVVAKAAEEAARKLLSTITRAAQDAEGRLHKLIYGSASFFRTYKEEDVVADFRALREDALRYETLNSKHDRLENAVDALEDRISDEMGREFVKRKKSPRKAAKRRVPHGWNTKKKSGGAR